MHLSHLTRHRRSVLRLLPVFALLALWPDARPAHAQTEPTPAPSPGGTPSTVERDISTPYEKLEQVFEKEDRGVFLPYREFLDLWNKLNLPADLKRNPPPVDGVLASARYVGRIEGDAAIFDARLQFDALKECWSKIPLGSADLNIAEVKPAPGSPPNAATPIFHAAADGYEAILPAKGSYPVAISLLGKITRDAGLSTLGLKLPRTAASQFELTIPETGLEFTLAPASAYTSTEDKGATRLTAFFGATQEIKISWRKRAAETTLPALVFAESTMEATVSPGALRTVAAIDFRLLRAPVGAFEILVPAGQQVLGVEGTALRDWNIAPATPDGRQHIVVNLATPARENYKLRVTLEAPVANLPTKLTVPTVEIARAEGQSGTVAVSADPALAVRVTPGEGVTQRGFSDAKPSGDATPSQAPQNEFLGAYRFLHLPYGIDVDVSAAEPVVEVDARTLYTVETDRLGWNAALSYNVRKAGIFTVLVDVPAFLGHVEAQGSPVESSSLVFPAAGASPVPAGYQRLEIRFKGRMLGGFSFSLVGDVPRTKPDDGVTISAPHPAGVARDEGQIAVAIHQSLDPKTAEVGDLRQESIDRIQPPVPPTDPRLNRHSAQPEQGASEVQEGEEVNVAPVEAGGDAPKVLELVEAALDAVALSIEGCVVGDGHLAVTLGRDDRFPARGRQQGTQRVGIIGAVGDGPFGADACEQGGRARKLGRLAGRQKQAQGAAPSVAKQVDLGG